MATSSYEKALRDSESELANLIRERERIDTRIGQATLAVRALINMLPDLVERVKHTRLLDSLILKSRKPGFVAVITSVLNGFPAGLTTVGIKNALINSGAIDLKEYSNPMASIHTTLRRLVESGELEQKTNEKGEKVYKIKGLHPFYGKL